MFMLGVTIILGIFLLISLMCVVKPEYMLNLQFKFSQLLCSLFGFKEDLKQLLKPTPKTIIVFRIFSLIVFIFFLALDFLVFYMYRKTFYGP